MCHRKRHAVDVVTNRNRVYQTAYQVICRYA